MEKGDLLEQAREHLRQAQKELKVIRRYLLDQEIQYYSSALESCQRFERNSKTQYRENTVAVIVFCGLVVLFFPLIIIILYQGLWPLAILPLLFSFLVIKSAFGWYRCNIRIKKEYLPENEERMRWIEAEISRLQMEKNQ